MEPTQTPTQTPPTPTETPPAPSPNPDPAAPSPTPAAGAQPPASGTVPTNQAASGGKSNMKLYAGVGVVVLLVLIYFLFMRG